MIEGVIEVIEERVFLQNFIIYADLSLESLLEHTIKQGTFRTNPHVGKAINVTLIRVIYAIMAA